MPSMKNLEMAAALSAYTNITIKKTLFGLSQKAVYVPTQSPVSVRIQEYAPADGERLERLLRLSPGQMLAEVQQKGKPASVPVGHFRLEFCQSDDRQFCAFQLFRFADFKYAPVTEPRFYEGLAAESVAQVV